VTETERVSVMAVMNGVGSFFSSLLRLFVPLFRFTAVFQ
jgi:hypothetical protein